MRQQLMKLRKFLSHQIWELKLLKKYKFVKKES
jgi:hypothetical protein